MFDFTNLSKVDTSPVIPDSWKWVLEVIDEAHLPHLGLPVTWPAIEESHMHTLFNPATNTTINIETGKVTKHKVSPVEFIKSTRGYHSMPGTERPAAVRLQRYVEPGHLSDAIVVDPHGHTLVPCIAHGDYVKVEALEADHIQAKGEIKRRQLALVQKLNTEPDFAAFVMQQDGMNKFFVQYKGKYYGTLYFYELYFNDIDNVWLICDACNLHKSNQETISWLTKQWLYGQEFLDYLVKKGIKQGPILTKIQDKKGLAKVAIEWFWNRHAHYISVAKRLYEEVTKQIEILNIKLDHVVGSGSQRRAERLQASLDARLTFLASIAKAPGLDMPKFSDESPHSSSDDNERLSPVIDANGKSIDVTREEYSAAVAVSSSKIARFVHDETKTELQAIVQKRSQSTSDDDRLARKPKLDGGGLS
jgi:hypothetical protein